MKWSTWSAEITVLTNLGRGCRPRRSRPDAPLLDAGDQDQGGRSMMARPPPCRQRAGETLQLYKNSTSTAGASCRARGLLMLPASSRLTPLVWQVVTARANQRWLPTISVRIYQAEGKELETTLRKRIISTRDE